MTKRVLFVGMPDSPHTARWINQISDMGWDLHLFPVYHAPTHPLLRGVTVHRPWVEVQSRADIRVALRELREFVHPRPRDAVAGPQEVRTRTVLPIPMMAPLSRRLMVKRTKPLGESSQTAPSPYGPWMLAKLIKSLQPDLIHSLEFQHAGYNVLSARDIFGKSAFPKWLATNWGSDIYYYRQFPEHRQQISRLLQAIDYYSCECERDIVLARELGLEAPALPVLPSAGGFNLAEVAAARAVLPPSKRRILMVKGYQHFAGRAVTALQAVARCADVLRDYRIVVFSAFAQDVRERIEDLRTFYNLNASILDYTSHERMLRYYSHARAYLSVSVSDAISTSMLEAMAMGAFPVQTNTACCDEWIEDGKSGFSIPPDDVEVIADRLRRAMTDDQLVDEATAINWKTIEQRLDERVLRHRAKEFYMKTNLGE